MSKTSPQFVVSFLWAVGLFAALSAGAAADWQGPVPLGESGVEVLQQGRESGDTPMPEAAIRAGLLPVLEGSGPQARLDGELRGIALRDRRSGRELGWAEARPLIAQALVASTVLETGYPGELRYVSAPQGAQIAIPGVYDAWLQVSGRSWIDDASQRQRLYRDAFLLSFANDRLRDRLHGDDWLVRSVQSVEGFFTGISDVRDTTVTIETGVRTYAGIAQTLQRNAQVMDLGQGSAALQSTGDIAQNVHRQVSDRFARSSQALTVLNVALSMVSSGMDEHARTALLTMAFEDARTLVLVEDLLMILRSDSSTDPAMIAGLEDAREEMARFAESRLRRVGATLRESFRAGVTAGGLALVAVKLGTVSTPAALAFAEGVNLYGAVQDLQAPLLATLVTLDRFLMGRVESLVVTGSLGNLASDDLDVPGLLAFQQQLGYQVIDVLYQSLWEGRLSFSLIGAQRALIFSYKDWRNKPLKSEIERLREAHFLRVAQNYALNVNRTLLLDEIGQIYGTRTPATPRDERTIIAVVDSSGSMRRTDPSNLRIAALRMLVDSLGEHMRFGIVEFASGPRAVAGLQALGPHDSREREALHRAVGQIDAGGQTDIRGGLVRALEIARDAGTTPVLILMSDGEDNQSHWRGEADFVPAGVVVHSIAFSDEADPEALARVSAATGGVAEIAETAADLQRIFGNLFGAAAGDEVMLVFQGRLHPGETVAHVVDIEPGQRQAEFRVTWPGSNIDLRLTAPGGRVHSTASAVAGGYGVERSTYDIIRVRDPQPGRWQVEVIGVELASGGEPYTLRVAGHDTALQTQWETNVTVPEVGQPFSLDLTGAGVNWQRAMIQTWHPDGRERSEERTLGGLGALLGGASGQTIYSMVPGEAGTYRVQIIVHGADAERRPVMRALDRSYRVAPPGEGVGRGSNIDPFIRRGVR